MVNSTIVPRKNGEVRNSYSGNNAETRPYDFIVNKKESD